MLKDAIQKIAELTATLENCIKSYEAQSSDLTNRTVKLKTEENALDVKVKDVIAREERLKPHENLEKRRQEVEAARLEAVKLKREADEAMKLLAESQKARNAENERERNEIAGIKASNEKRAKELEKGLLKLKEDRELMKTKLIQEIKEGLFKS